MMNHNDKLVKLTDDEFNKEIAFELNGIKNERILTSVQKDKFIKEIKDGLGKEIKVKHGTITHVKKTKLEKIKLFFKTLFKIF